MAESGELSGQLFGQLYGRYQRALQGQRLPAALVDLDALDRNIDALLAPVKAGGKRLRLASKSIRCLALIRYITERGGPTIRGVMAYSAAEAAFLVDNGFDDVLLAYPTVQEADAKLIAQCQLTAELTVVVDASEQLDALAAAAAALSVRIPVLAEADVSYRPLGGRMHLGVRRSPLHTVEQVVAFAEAVSARAELRFVGIMAYEAQIAGVTDNNPFTPVLNAPKRAIKLMSRPNVEKKRARIVEELKRRKMTCDLVNGGGTGSLGWCSTETALTEVTAGSGFLQSHLFDYYRESGQEPAALFALQTVRRPAPDIVTCHGGGFIASGQSGPDRAPVVWLPEGLELTDLEGAGEVQTPLQGPAAADIELGAPVFFRHAKAGELAEHFNQYLLLRDAQVEDEVPTYRGQGHCFL